MTLRVELLDPSYAEERWMPVPPLIPADEAEARRVANEYWSRGARGVRILLFQTTIIARKVRDHG